MGELADRKWQAMAVKHGYKNEKAMFKDLYYKEKLSCRQIKKKIGVHVQTRMKKLGFKLRSVGGANYKKTLNNDEFRLCLLCEKRRVAKGQRAHCSYCRTQIKTRPVDYPDMIEMEHAVHL